MAFRSFHETCTWMRWEEAPAAWLAERNREWISQTIQIISWSILSLGVLGFVGPFNAVPGLVPWIISSGAIGLGSVRAVKHLQVSDDLFYRLLCLYLCVAGIGGKYNVVFIADPVARNRLMVMGHTVWPSFVSLLGLRVREAILLMAWMYTHTALSCFLCGWWHGDRFHLRYYAYQLIIHVAHVFIARLQQVFLRELYDVQRQLKIEKEDLWVTQKQLREEKVALHNALDQLRFEKEASESLLGMVCDSCLWLSSDGNTIVRSDPHWHSIVGLANDMAGCDYLSDHLSPQDHKRLKHVLEGEAKSSALPPVRLLPISLMQHGQQEPVNVDLFIVDRCRRSQSTPSESTDSSLPAVYLLGIRLSDPSSLGTGSCAGVATRPNVDVAAEISNAMADARLGKRELTSDRLSWISRTEIEDADSQLVDPPAGKTCPAWEKRPPPYGDAFQASSEYLLDMLESVIYNMVECMNFETEFCCAFHSAASRAEEILRRISAAHSCGQAWPIRRPTTWQCSHCTAVLDTDCCWICESVFGCGSPGGSEEGSVTSAKVRKAQNP